MKGFRDFLKEDSKIYFTFGRMNPPTIGHGKLLDRLAEEAGTKPYKIFLSKSYDTKKNPLLYENKIKYTRKFFPRHARKICDESKVKDILGAAVSLYDDGYKSIVCVVGEDRVNEFRERLNLYNGKSGRHGLYVFESIEVISAGQRDPDSENIEGISSSKLREAAENGDFVSFSQGLPKQTSNNEAKKFFKEVREGLNVKESVPLKNHIKLKPVSEIRERYINGDLFDIDDEIIIKETQELAYVKILGSNYVIVESNDGKRYRKWLNDIEKIN